jgi:hypothetical protein
MALFPTWLLTSEDEYKWYWHQMIYFPETINTISTTITPSPIHSLVSPWAMHINLLCACWHYEAIRGSSSLASCRLLTSSLFPCLGSTDAPCSRLGDPALLPQYGCPIHRVRAHSLIGIRNRHDCTFQPAKCDNRARKNTKSKTEMDSSISSWCGF